MIRKAAPLAVLSALALLFVPSALTQAAEPEVLLEEAKTELLAANRISARNNSYRRDNPNEYAQVVAYLTGGARPAGNLTRMGNGLVLLEDARREIGGDPTPTPTPTPEPPPPPPVGTTINVNSVQWRCDRPLAQYGALPIRVIWNGRSSADAISISSNCAGDGTPAVDLILNVNGNGADLGPGQDAVKVGSSPGTVRPHDIEISGYAQCGSVSPSSAHQDVVQILSGERITFVDFSSGNVQQRTFTCRGAGGAFFPTSTAPGDPNRQPRDVVCVRCQFVTSNHGLNIGWSLRSGAIDSTFIGQRPITFGSGSSAPQSPININNSAIDTG